MICQGLYAIFLLEIFGFGVWVGLALPDMGGQPSQHLFAFFLAPDFHGAAVLLAFPFGLAELTAEGGELVSVHHIDLVVFGDIGPEVAVGVLHIEGPDFVICLQTFAQVAAHKSEAGRPLSGCACVRVCCFKGLKRTGELARAYPSLVSTPSRIRRLQMVVNA